MNWVLGVDWKGTNCIYGNLPCCFYELNFHNAPRNVNLRLHVRIRLLGRSVGQGRIWIWLFPFIYLTCINATNWMEYVEMRCEWRDELFWVRCCYVLNGNSCRLLSLNSSRWVFLIYSEVAEDKEDVLGLIDSELNQFSFIKRNNNWTNCMLNDSNFSFMNCWLRTTFRAPHFVLLRVNMSSVDVYIGIICWFPSMDWRKCEKQGTEVLSLFTQYVLYTT